MILFLELKRTMHSFNYYRRQKLLTLSYELKCNAIRKSIVFFLVLVFQFKKKKSFMINHMNDFETLYIRTIK